LFVVTDESFAVLAAIAAGETIFVVAAWIVL